MKKERNLVVVSGPSGCGKDTVVGKMREKHPEIEFSVSATSRKMRQGEENGVHYHFLTREQFEDKIQQGEILEYTQFNGNYYGTPKQEVDRRIENGKTLVLVIEVEGAANIRRMYPDATTVFLMPPSIEELERRLRGRGTETEESIRNRLSRAKAEMKQAILYTAQLVNDDVESCADKLYEIIRNRQQAEE